MPSAKAIVILVSGLVLGGSACGLGSEPGHRLTVQVVAARPGTICDEPGGRDYQGMSFTVLSESGNVLAAGALGPWKALPPDLSRSRLCSFRAEVEVADSPSYSIRFQGKKPLSFPRADLVATGWVASIDAVPWRVSG